MFGRANGAAPPAFVLFVCLGNICRSPTAEGVLRAAANRAGLGRRIRVDSAGLGDGQIGSPPDRRAIQAARRRGYDLTAIRARQVEIEDFSRFGWVIAMDAKRSSPGRKPGLRKPSRLLLDLASLGVATSVPPEVHEG
jgi:protein-tyrosine phosphatase